MSSKATTVGLVVANMIEKGINGRLKDGDEICLLSYTDKLNTNVVASLKWISSDSRHVSNLIFLKIKQLRMLKKIVSPIKTGEIFNEFKTNFTVYLVTDGNREIVGGAIENIIRDIFVFNKERWRKEKLICLVGMDIGGLGLENWAIGEASTGMSVKTLAKMPEKEIALEKAKVSEKEKEKVDVKRRETAKSVVEKKAAEDLKVSEVHGGEKKTNDSGVKIKSIEIKGATNVVITTTEPGLVKISSEKVESQRQATNVSDISVVATNKVVDKQKNVESGETKNLPVSVNQGKDVSKDERESREKVNVVGESLRKDERIIEKTNFVLDTKKTSKFTSDSVGASNVCNEIKTNQITQVKESNKPATEVAVNVGVNKQGEGNVEIRGTNMAVVIYEVASNKPQNKIEEHATNVEKQVKVGTSTFTNLMTEVSGLSNKESTGLMVREKAVGLTNRQLVTQEVVSLVGDKGSDWLLKTAIGLAGMAVFLWGVTVIKIRSNTAGHSLITKGFSKRNMVRRSGDSEKDL